MIGILSRPNLRNLAGLLVILLTVALPATLRAQGPPELARATVHAGGVDFWPLVEYSRAFVTLSGGEVLIERTFESGDNLSIGIFDVAGQLLPDGVYSWRLELVPDTATASELRVAASALGGEPPGAWQPISGTFAFRDASVASAELAEPGARDDGFDLEAGPQFDSGLGSSFGRSAPGEDEDAAIGTRVGVEEETRAGIAAVPALIAGSGNMNLERADEGARAMGGSLESLLRPTAFHNLVGENQPAPRSISPDGKNGRPTSEDEVR